jgi:enoyl-CoA hydratase/carnithine racemase
MTALFASREVPRNAARIVDLDRQQSGATPSARLPILDVPVVIGVAAEPHEVAEEHFDVLLTSARDAPRPWVACANPHATANLLARTVDEHTQAAVALAQVLRMGETLGLAERLAAESLAYSVLQTGAGFGSWLATAPRQPARPAEEPVRLERDGSLLTVTLQRPWVRNAVDAATRDALHDALTVAVVDPSVTRVDLRGDGPAFCSGGDLSEFGTSRDPAAAHFLRLDRSPAAQLLRCPAHVTAYLHGTCVGAGIELAAFADRVVSAPDTLIRLPEIGMGLIPGAGGTASIPARIGRHRTAYLALSGADLEVDQALEWGLVDAVTQTSGPRP